MLTNKLLMLLPVLHFNNKKVYIKYMVILLIDELNFFFYSTEVKECWLTCSFSPRM